MLAKANFICVIGRMEHKSGWLASFWLEQSWSWCGHEDHLACFLVSCGTHLPSVGDGETSFLPPCRLQEKKKKAVPIRAQLPFKLINEN